MSEDKKRVLNILYFFKAGSLPEPRLDKLLDKLIKLLDKLIKRKRRPKWTKLEMKKETLQQLPIKFRKSLEQT